MMKSIGTVQLALATVFVVPAVTGQDQGVHSLQSQLSATLNSLDYLSDLRDRAATGDKDAIGAIVASTETPRKPERAGGPYLESLQTDLARLRFQLDRLLGTPSEVEAIMQLPGGVVRSGSKVGSKYPKMFASTNDAFCPTLRGSVKTELDMDIESVMEIVTDLRPGTTAKFDILRDGDSMTLEVMVGEDTQ